MSTRRTVETLAPILIGLTLLTVLGSFAAVDPPSGFTVSSSPFTDEAWDVVNARNLVLLGRWSTDDWNLHLVNVPFSLAQAAMFQVAGVGIVQARLVAIGVTALTVVALGLGLRRAMGTGAALLAAIAFGTSALVLYYGRLAYLEPMVALGLTLGGLCALRVHDERAGRWGVLAGFALDLGIGAKPSALFAAIGILVGLAVVGGRSSPTVRRWLAGAIAAIALGGLAWLLAVGLPNQAAVAADLRIWASEPLPGTIYGLLARIISFAIRNDQMLSLALPLLAAGASGLVLAIRYRRELSNPVRGLAAAATGWLVFGYGILAIVPYRPNRYEVPLLPALAILTAIGWSLAAPRIARWLGTLRTRLVAVGVLAGLSLPGTLMFIGWMMTTGSSLPAIQETVRAMIPAGAAAEGGLAATFALRAPVVALVSRPSVNINSGDLYASRGVRWYIGDVGSHPAWADLHPLQWAARTERMCAAWGDHQVCVWQMP